MTSVKLRRWSTITLYSTYHNAEFNELLEKLPQPPVGNLLAVSTHIDHYLSSLSELLPAELTADYETPRKTVEDEHATIHDGRGFPTLQAVQDAALAAERMKAAADVCPD